MESLPTFLTSGFSLISGDHFRAPVGRFKGPRGVENLGTLYSRYTDRHSKGSQHFDAFWASGTADGGENGTSSFFIIPQHARLPGGAPGSGT